jgi:hypothetical protein
VIDADRSIVLIAVRRVRVGICFDTATTYGRPSSEPLRTSKSPAAKNARYGAIGSRDRQWVVASPPLTTRSTSEPLEITFRCFGTVIRTSMVALSRGWSLAGNHHGAMCGSFIVTTSRSSASQLRWPR